MSNYPTVYIKPTFDTQTLVHRVNVCLTEAQMYNDGMKVNDPNPTFVPSGRSWGQLLASMQHTYVSTKKWIEVPDNVKHWSDQDFGVAHQVLDQLKEFLLTGEVQSVKEEA
jgi:hypothetical protein